jgi:hypothetical protein
VAFDWRDHRCEDEDDRCHAHRRRASIGQKR